ARRLRSGADLVRGSAEDVLGEPRSDAGHAPGERHRYAVPLRHLLLRRFAEAGGGTVARRVPARDLEGRLRRDHDRDPSGARVLLRRGLPPAVPVEEPRRLLRAGRDRRELSCRPGGPRQRVAARMAARERPLVGAYAGVFLFIAGIALGVYTWEVNRREAELIEGWVRTDGTVTSSFGSGSSARALVS